MPDKEVSTARKKLVRFGAAVLTVLGGFVSLMTLYPRVTVTISFDTKEPLLSSFLISNDGYFPIYSVSADCLFGAVMTEPAQPTEAEMKTAAELGSVTHISDIPTPTLAPGAKEVLPFSNCINVSPPAVLSYADVGFRVIYRPLLWFRNRSATQEF